jgi:hypothetical protein
MTAPRYGDPHDRDNFQEVVASRASGRGNFQEVVPIMRRASVGVEAGDDVLGDLQ